jgi:hypothetical protein
MLWAAQIDGPGAVNRTRPARQEATMDIRPKAKVSGTDGPVGQVTHVILDPATDRVTHLAVSGPATGPVLVPLHHVVAADPENVRLDIDAAQVGALQSFVEHELITVQRSASLGQEFDAYVYLGGPGPRLGTDEVVDHTHQRVPEGEIAVGPGAQVHAADGFVGEVHHFLVDRIDGRLTHFVLREGHFWGRREVQVPLGAIDRIDEADVYLNLSKAEIGALPSVKAR